MRSAMTTIMKKGFALVAVFALALTPLTSRAQDRLKTMPGYDQYQKISAQIPGSVKLGSLPVKWLDGGKAFEYYKDGKSYRYDIATNAATEAGVAPPDAEGGRGGRRRGGPERGRQFGSATSPDGKLKAFN